MNAPFTYSFHKAIVTSMLLFGFTALTVMAQTTPNTQPPTAAPAQAPSRPAVATQNPNAPVRIAPAQQPVSGQVGTTQQNSDRSVPTSQFMNNQNSVAPTQTENANPAGGGYNNTGGIVNSAPLQNDSVNHVHYHYHYDNQGGSVANTAAGYAPTTYATPSTLPATVAAKSNSMMQPAYGSANPAPMNVDAGNMYVNNPNMRVGGGGVPTTWNPFLNNGSGMLTYGGGGGSGVQGFND